MSWRLVARRPGMMLASVAVIGGAGIFGWNVLMSQTARHPAPLFAGTKPAVAAVAPVEPPRRSETAVAPPLPTPRPEPASFAGRPEPTVTRSTDAIGAMIRGGDPAPRATEPKAASRAAEPKPAAASRAADSKPAAATNLASAQKALAKLGYGPITADGVMGTTTRQAIEKFERDKKLPVTGALGSRTAKQLASASGIKVVE